MIFSRTGDDVSYPTGLSDHGKCTGLHSVMTVIFEAMTV